MHAPVTVPAISTERQPVVAAADPIGHAFVATDHRGRIRFWSPGAQDLYGWSSAEAVGTSLAALIGGDERRAIQAMHRAAVRRGSWTGIVWPTRRDGAACRVEIHAVALDGKAGAATGVMAAHIDLSRRERVKAAEGRMHFEAALLERIESVMVAADARNRVIYWNDAAATAYGFRSDQALGRHVDKLLPAGDSEERRRQRRRLRAGDVVSVDAADTDSGGRPRILNTVIAPIHDDVGTYEGWVSIGHDVTAQRLADARLAAVVESAPFAVVLIDAELAMQYANPAAAQIAGRPRDELLEHGWVAAIHPDDRDRTRQAVETALASGHPVRMVGRALGTDGSIRHFSAEVMPIELAGTVAGCAVIAFRIPDAASGNMADATRGHILDEISNAVVVTGLDGIVRYWNAAAERRFGWSAADVVGQRAVDLGIVSDPEVVETMTAGLMREGRWVGEVPHQRRDGTAGEAYVTASLVLDEAGQPESVVSVSADLDPIKDRQAALELQSQVVAGIDAGAWLVDPATHRVAFVNAGYERMLGLRLEDIQADPWVWLTRVHPDDRGRVRAALEADPIGMSIEYRIEAVPGDPREWRQVQARTLAVPHRGGGVRWVAGMFSDITSLRAAESRLQQMGTAIAQSSDGVLLVDADWRALYVNEAFESITGHRRDAILGQRPLHLIGDFGDPQSPVAEIVAAALHGEPWSGPMQGVRADGIPLHVEISVWPISDPHGATSSIVTMVRKRSDTAALREQVERRARLQTAIGTAMAHLGPGASIEEAADAIIRPALELEGVDVVTIMAFTNGKIVVPLAALGPRAMPISTGLAMPSATARRLRHLGRQGPAVVEWDLLEEESDYGRRWTDLGLSAVAYVPLLVDGEPVGLVTAGSTDRNGRSLLAGQLAALTEYGAMASALLGQRLGELRASEDRRTALTTIIATRAFHPVFQPIVDLASDTVVGYEALTRFADGEPPDRRFREAEPLGLGTQLEVATIRAACEAARTLPEGAWLSVNASPALVTEYRGLRRLLGRARRPIVLEITERTAVEDYATVRQRITEMGGRIRLAVDDAGAGFASLRHIIELRPDMVKLDMGLVRHIGRDQARQALVAGMVHFAGETGCLLVAEGIETEAELKTLRRLGVQLGQGYLLGRPAPTDDE